MLAGITAASEERGKNFTTLKCELSRNLMKQLKVNGILPPLAMSSSHTGNHNHNFHSTATRAVTPSPSNNNSPLNTPLRRSNKSSWSVDSAYRSAHNSPAKKKPFAPSSFHNEHNFQPVQFDFSPDQMFVMDFCPVPAAGSEMEQHAPYYYSNSGSNQYEGCLGNNGQGPQAEYFQQYQHDLHNFQPYYVPVATFPHHPAAYPHYPYPAHMGAPPMAMPYMQQMAYVTPGWNHPNLHPHLHPHPHLQPQFHQQSHMQHQPCYYEGDDCDTNSINTGSISSDNINSDCDNFLLPHAAHPTFIGNALGPYPWEGDMPPPFPMLMRQQDSMSPCPSHESLCISPLVNDEFPIAAQF